MSRYRTSCACLSTLLALSCSESGPAASVPAASGGAGAGVAGEPFAQAGGQPATEGGAGNHAGGGSNVADGGEPAASDACSFSGVTELSVFSPSWDALGYPPYAIDGCTLVYVALEGEGGALVRVDLATNTRTVLAEPSGHPSRPTLAAGIIAWEHDGTAARAVTVLSEDGARTFEGAVEPSVTADALVFTKLLGAQPEDDTDVYLFELGADEAKLVAGGAGQQRFADVSPTHVAVSDFSEDPRGYFDELASIADVVVIDRLTGEATTRARPGKQAFPLLGSADTLVYQEWGAVHPEPKFSQFFLNVARISEPVSADFNVKGEDPVSTEIAYVRPALHGTRLDFVDRGDSVQLYSAELSAPEVKPVAMKVDALQLYGPAATARATLVASRVEGQNLRLIAVER
jgi:hypothetical protein